jgi:MraZ protein
MLIGSYLGTLNEKRRVSVPKKFLVELGEKPIIGKWYEGCLVLVSQSFWEKLLDRLTGGKRAIDLGVRDIERFILGSAFELEPDDQGRVVISEILTEYAGITKDLIFIGLGDRAEVWAKETWNNKTLELSKTTKEYIESISKK